MCRIGKKEEVYHCHTCSCDFPIEGRDQHQCTRNGLKTNCPICMENLFHSRKVSVRLNNCGHYIHRECLNNYVKISQANKCPLCSKSLVVPPPEYIEMIE
mmetsp:Transcript_22977/g.19940  ORF Transcript_22977/g.19940 Transcript_22977/m.19940 type:complete len:100 (+) Transcript_22977:400-699(+)